MRECEAKPHTSATLGYKYHPAHAHTHTHTRAAITTVPNVITNARFFFSLSLSLCSCIPFAILILILFLIPPAAARAITYVQHRSTLCCNIEGDLEIEKLQQLCAVCLCFSNEQRDDAAALSFAHWCCSLSDTAHEQQDADPVKCSGILALVGGGVYD